MIWAHLLEKAGHLTDENRDRINQWDSGPKSSERIMELMLRLDRTDLLVSQPLSSIKPSSTSTYMGEEVPRRPTDSSCVGGPHAQTSADVPY